MADACLPSLLTTRYTTTDLAVMAMTDVATVAGTDREAVEMAAYLLRNEGLWVGSSAAMNCVGAVKVRYDIELTACGLLRGRVRSPQAVSLRCVCVCVRVCPCYVANEVTSRCAHDGIPTGG